MWKYCLYHRSETLKPCIFRASISCVKRSFVSFRTSFNSVQPCTRMTPTRHTIPDAWSRDRSHVFLVTKSWQWQRHDVHTKPDYWCEFSACDVIYPVQSRHSYMLWCTPDMAAVLKVVPRVASWLPQRVYCTDIYKIFGNEMPLFFCLFKLLGMTFSILLGTVLRNWPSLSACIFLLRLSGNT